MTIPDDTQLEPGAEFEKTWAVENSGTCKWEESFVLRFVSGEQMGAPAFVSMAAAEPGETIRVSVSLKAPDEPARHIGVWKLCSEDECFEGGITVQIVTKGAGEPNESRVRISAFKPKDKPEYIELYNDGPAEQDMTGWRIRSVKGDQWYDFPSGYVLAAEASVRIYSGKDSPHNPPGELRWVNRNMWNNEGDPAELYDAAGNLVDSAG